MLLVRAVVHRSLGPPLAFWSSVIPARPAQERPRLISKIATVMLGRLQLHPTPLSTFFPVWATPDD